MITRRVLLGSALVAASAIAPAFARVPGAISRSGPAPRTIEALLVDQTILMPRELSALIAAGRHTVPIVDLTLDAGAHNGLQQTLRESGALVGISSGATLFCVERMAWDHGHRLTARSPRSAANMASCRSDLAAMMSGARPAATSRSAQLGAYAPSRLDGLLHVWVIERKPPLPSDQAGLL
jgi:hypothetical protein